MIFLSEARALIDNGEITGCFKTIILIDSNNLTIDYAIAKIQCKKIERKKSIGK
jgi:hypothetical protein